MSIACRTNWIGCRNPQALPAPAAAVAAGHVGGGPGLVDEDEPLGVEVQLAVEPGAAPLQDIGAVLLGRVRGLFFPGDAVAVEDTRDQRSYLAWLTLWLSRARGLVGPGGIGCVFTDWRQLPTTTDALQAAGWVWRGIVPWDKTEGGRPQQGRYRAQAEYVVRGTDGPRTLSGPVAPGVFRAAVPRQKHHIAGKPVALMEGLLAPMEAGAILDPFMGSGAVGLACQAAGRPYVERSMRPISRSPADGFRRG